MFEEKQKVKEFREKITAEIVPENIGDIDLLDSDLNDDDLITFCDMIKNISKKSFSIEKLDLSNNKRIKNFSTTLTFIDTLVSIGLKSISILLIQNTEISFSTFDLVVSTIQDKDSKITTFCKHILELDLTGKEISYEMARSFCSGLFADYSEGKLKTIKLSISIKNQDLYQQFKKEPLFQKKFKVLCGDGEFVIPINSSLSSDKNLIIPIPPDQSSPLSINDETTPLLMNNNNNREREHWLRYEFSPLHSLMPLPLRVADLSTRSLIWLASKTPGSRGYALVNHISNFINGSTTTLNVLWPLALFGLTLRDIIYYATVPQNRYENSVGTILGGFAPNESTWTTHFGSYLAGNWQQFSAGPIGLVVAPIAAGITQAIRLGKRHNADNVNNPNQNSLAAVARKEFAVIHNRSVDIKREIIINQLKTIAIRGHSLLIRLSALQSLATIIDACKRDTLNFLSKEKKDEIFAIALTGLYEAAQLIEDEKKSPLEWIRTIYADHLLWSLNENAESTRSKLYHAGEQAFLFWPITLYQWYANVRWLQIIVKKIIEGFQYYSNMQVCEAKNGKWGYLEWLGDYACTVCGDWSFANYQDMFSAQGCLNNLLAEQRDPQLILDAISRFQQHPDIKVFDGSQQQFWTLWTPSQLQILVDKLLPIENLVLDSFNVSQPNPNYQPITQQVLSDLNRLLKQVPVKNLVMQNVPGGPEMITTLGPSLNSTTSVDFTGAALGDQGWNELTQQGAFKQMSKVVVGNNQIDSEAIIQTSNQIIHSGVTQLDLSTNQINTQQGLDAVANAMQHLQELDLSDNNLSGFDLRSLGEAIQQASSLDTLNLMDCHLTDQQIIRLAPYFKNSSIKNLSVSGNQLTGEGVANLLSNFNPNQQVSVDVSDNRIFDRDMRIIAEVAEGLSLNLLNLADNHFSVKGLQFLLDKIPQIQINGINVANNSLGDDLADAFYNLLTQFKTTLRSINLANNDLTEIGGITLAKGIAQSNSTISQVELQNNPECGGAVASAFATTITLKQDLNYLDLSFCGIDSQGGKDLCTVIQQCSLETLLLNGNLFDDTVGICFAENLITPTPNLYNAYQDNTHNDEARRIRKSVPATQLQRLEIGEGLGIASARALYLVWPSTRNSFSNLYVNGSPLSPDKLNEKAASTKSSVENQFQQNTMAFQFFQTQATLPNTQLPNLSSGEVNSASTNTSLNLAVSLNLLPGLQLLILMYVIYRMIKPLVRSVFTSSTHFFQSSSTNNAQKISKKQENNEDDTVNNTVPNEEKFEI